MAKIEQIKSPVAQAIEAHYRANRRTGDGFYLAASEIGAECERSLWYSFRWTTTLRRPDGRAARLFETGDREEQRMIGDLRAIGCDVQDRDPGTTKQFTAILSGVLKVKIDGKISNVPGAEKTPHLLECKTHNDKSFQDWRRKGVEAAKPVHFAQCQIGSHAFGLTRALYVAHNKNTDEVETERVKYDPLVASAIIAKAERIAFAARPPAKLESFACRWCKHNHLCLEGAWPRANCRTCLHANLNRSGEWSCLKHLHDLDIDAQKAGCDQHLYIPDLVPGEQIDADEDANTVSYELIPDARPYVDGKDEKISAPEVDP